MAEGETQLRAEPLERRGGRRDKGDRGDRGGRGDKGGRGKKEQVEKVETQSSHEDDIVAASARAKEKAMPAFPPEEKLPEIKTAAAPVKPLEINVGDFSGGQVVDIEQYRALYAHSKEETRKARMQAAAGAGALGAGVYYGGSEISAKAAAFATSSKGVFFAKFVLAPFAVWLTSPWIEKVGRKFINWGQWLGKKADLPFPLSWVVRPVHWMGEKILKTKTLAEEIKKEKEEKEKYIQKERLDIRKRQTEMEKKADQAAKKAKEKKKKEKKLIREFGEEGAAAIIEATEGDEAEPPEAEEPKEEPKAA